MELNHSEKTQYKLLTFISMLYLTADIASTLLGYRYVHIFSFILPASPLVYVLCYPIGDSIAEVYGFKMLKRIIWFRLLCDYIFGLFLYFALSFPVASNIATPIDYQNLQWFYMRGLISGTIAVFCASLINGYLIAKWKALIRGRFFWLRSMGSSSIAVITSATLVLIGSYAGVVKFSVILELSLHNFLFELAVIALITPLLSVLVMFLKIYEKADVYDDRVLINPLKL